jgi:ABC-2 type transport system ATP-binding protein
MGEGTMSQVVVARGISKRYGGTAALDNVSFAIEENTIYGLLGRNGAGKSTLMQILTGQVIANAGDIKVFGGHPYENDAVLSRICFVKESQRYPEVFTVRSALDAAGYLFPRWDDAYALSLVDEYRLSLRQRVRKLSRGQLSAVGVIIGLASRAELTFFDEPYLGLDAVARRLFYDRLLADYAEHPRTVVLSTHLIDEVSDLVEHALVLDGGQLIVDEDVEALRGQVVTLTGPAGAVDAVAAGHTELHRDRMGGVVRATVRARFDDTERAQAKANGLDVEPVSLQELIIRLTTSGKADQLTKEMSR